MRGRISMIFFRRVIVIGKRLSCCLLDFSRPIRTFDSVKEVNGSGQLFSLCLHAIADTYVLAVLGDFFSNDK